MRHAKAGDASHKKRVNIDAAYQLSNANEICPVFGVVDAGDWGAVEKLQCWTGRLQAENRNKRATILQN